MIVEEQSKYDSKFLFKNQKIADQAVNNPSFGFNCGSFQDNSNLTVYSRSNSFEIKM